MFQIGESVYYPMHGVGVIESIEDKEVLGETASYYILRFVIGRMMAMVPVATAESVGLRPVIGKKECEDVVDYLRQDTCQESDSWNQRYRDNLDKLRLGDIYGVADVVKCLVKRDRDRGLSAGERKMYITARQVLLAELMAASGKEEGEFLELIGGE